MGPADHKKPGDKTKRKGKGKRALRPEEIEHTLQLKDRGFPMAVFARMTGLDPRTVKGIWARQETVASRLERLGLDALKKDPKLRAFAGEMQAMAIIQRKAEESEEAPEGRIELQLSRRLHAALKRQAQGLGLTLEAPITDAIWFWLVATDAEGEDDDEDDEFGQGEEDWTN